MCNFLSIVEDKKGKLYYMKWRDRKQACESYDMDSHSYIALVYFGTQFKPPLNNYEYNPWNKTLKTDSIMFESDINTVEKKCSQIDMSEVCPFINFSRIPKLKPAKEVTAQDIDMLHDYMLVTEEERVLDLINMMPNVGEVRHSDEVYACMTKMLKSASDIIGREFQPAVEYSFRSKLNLVYATDILDLYPLTRIKYEAKEDIRKYFSDRVWNKLFFAEDCDNPHYPTKYFWGRTLIPRRVGVHSVIFDIKGNKLFSMCYKQLLKISCTTRRK